MKIAAIKNACYADREKTMINCEVKINSIGWLPFTASKHDTEQHCREVYEAINATGNIAPYVDGKNENMIVPSVITARQIRLVLHNIGKLDDVFKAISNLPEPQKTYISIEWEYATLTERNGSLVGWLASELKLTNGQLDRIFIEGAVL